MLSDKEITSYFFDDNKSIQGHVSYDDYSKHPASAFLQYANDATKAVETCKKSFPFDDKNKIESLASIQNIINSSLATIMGHFETYEKHLFAGIFERSVYFNNFDAEKFFNKIYNEHRPNNKITTIEISTMQVLGYRTFPASSGMLIADSLKGWHNPEIVNIYFEAYNFNKKFFNEEDITDLKILWQLRHSIVHTADTITRSDSQKVPQLFNMGERRIVFSNKFTYELTKRFHNLILHATTRMKECTQEKLDRNLCDDKVQEILSLFYVSSENQYMLT